MGSTLDMYDTLQQQMDVLFFFTKVVPLWGGRTVQGTDANVHSLDGYTCQGTPLLMDWPQKSIPYKWSH